MNPISAASPLQFIGDTLKGATVMHKKTTIGDLKGVLPMNPPERKSRKSNRVPGRSLFPGAGRYKRWLVLRDYKTPARSGRGNISHLGIFHAQSDRGEFYWGIRGEGELLLMSRDRSVRTEKMYPGSLHYIPAHTAHRVANTGSGLIVVRGLRGFRMRPRLRRNCQNGFAARLVNRDGKPQLIKA